jgi:hypothetical protein
MSVMSTNIMGIKLKNKQAGYFFREFLTEVNQNGCSLRSANDVEPRGVEINKSQKTKKSNRVRPSWGRFSK